LAALFRVNAGIGALRIDEHKNRTAEFRGEIHCAQSLAIALRLRLAKVAADALLGVASLLAADDEHGLAVKTRHAGDESRVIREATVAMDFAKVFENEADEIFGVGTLRVTCQLDARPGAEVRVKFVLQLVDLAAQPLNIGALFFEAGEIRNVA